MEEIYANVEFDKSDSSVIVTNPTGPRSSERRCHGAAVLSLGLLSVLLLVGLIGLGVHYRESVRGSAAVLSIIKAKLDETKHLLNVSVTEMTEEQNRLQSLTRQNLSSTKSDLNERLRVSNNQLSSVTRERDQLKARLVEMTKARDTLIKEKTCPAGWTRFSCSCYLLSTQTGSWTTGRQDCRNRGADLVVVDSAKEQTFITGLTRKETWIGLSDRDQEGTYRWTDETSLTLTFWSVKQPDNGNGDPQWGEEDCVQIEHEAFQWNDRSCDAHLRWMCEKRLSSDVC